MLQLDNNVLCHIGLDFVRYENSAVRIWFRASLSHPVLCVSPGPPGKYSQPAAVAETVSHGLPTEAARDRDPVMRYVRPVAARGSMPITDHPNRSTVIFICHPGLVQ